MNKVSGISSPRSAVSLPVLVHAPYGEDMSTVARLLEREGVSVRRVVNGGDLRDMSFQDVGVFVLSQEGLTPRVLSLLAEQLVAQPNWAEVPLVLLLDHKVHSPAIIASLRKQLPRAKLIVLERPLRNTEFSSVVQGALASRRHQYAVRDHLAHQEELRRELNHRIKNILASVTGLFELSLRSAPDSQTLATDFRGRLQALGAVHTALYERSAQQLGLHRIVAATIAPLSADARIVVDGPDVDVETQVAEELALVLHELLTNALKHGALSTPRGQVAIRWRRIAGTPHRVAFEWLESGGPLVAEPRHRGYGTRFIDRTFPQYGGPRLKFNPEGLSARIELDVTDEQPQLS